MPGALVEATQMLNQPGTLAGFSRLWMIRVSLRGKSVIGGSGRLVLGHGKGAEPHGHDQETDATSVFQFRIIFLPRWNRLLACSMRENYPRKSDCQRHF